MTSTLLGRRCATFVAMVVLGLGGATTAPSSVGRTDSAVVTRATTTTPST